MTITFQLKTSLVLASPLLIAFGCNATAEKTTWSPTVLGFEPPTPGLFGDWGGMRTTLADNGFNYALIYSTESAYNAYGGFNTDKHFAFADQTALLFNQDLEQLTGISDAKIEGLITNRNHDDNLTTERVQDPRARFNDLTQEVWGGGSITRLGYLTFSRTFDDRKLKWRIGQMNYQQTFDQSIPCDFQVLSLCGGKSAYAQTWSTWNIHSWGTTFAYVLTSEVTIKTGVLEQNPRANERSRSWSFNSNGSKGVLLPLEVEYKTMVNGLPGVYNAGILYTNSPQYDLYTPAGKTTKVYDNTWFFWGGFNQQITQKPADREQGMSISASMSVADERSNPYHIVASAEMRYRGLFDARPQDYLGLGVSWFDMSNHLAQSARESNYSNNIRDYYNPLYQPVAGNAINFDLYYRLRPVSWLDIQPDIQYWINPGGIKETKDALVIGLKTAVRF
ncbi:TPA: carbohydrate porin [Klebsiella pneumoniae]|nr:putative carbohydrate-selective porin [Klebsiella pneumoniae]HBY0059697.1 carbohydrate porin [Klebsiella pneumoniae]HBY2315537.1 carbohydrate porin [Klebsiella pneumoniae]